MDDYDDFDINLDAHEAKDFDIKIEHNDVELDDVNQCDVVLSDIKSEDVEPEDLEVEEIKPILSIDLQPAWSDYTRKEVVKKQYKCLDIKTVIEEKKSIKKMKTYSVLSKEKILPPGLLDFYRCTDGNRDYTGKQHVSFALLHTTKKFLVTGTQDSMLCLFNIDGESNSAICKPIYQERYPIKGGRLHPDGKRLIYHSKFNSFRVFNMVTSTTVRHTIATNKVVIRRMEISPSGEYTVFSSTESLIYVVSNTNFEVVDILQTSDKVHAMAFSHQGKYLYAFAADGLVYTWEFREKQKAIFRRRWTDHGTIKGSSISISPDDKYLACGSSTSTVNLYLLADTWKSLNPTPIKTFNSFGRVNLLTFNNSSEIMAMGSCMEDGSQRLVHLASMTIFSNFPGAVGKQKPTSFSFSVNDKYFAVGQSNGRVALYSINYYDKY